MQEELPLLCENNQELQNELGVFVCLHVLSPTPLPLALHALAWLSMYVHKYMH